MNSSTFTSLSLKLVGIIFTISWIVDTLTRAIPFNWQDSQWRINFAADLVDRGIIPLLGMTLVLLGYWIDNNSGTPAKGAGLRMPVFGLATFLGLFFLLLVPVHLSSLNQAKTVLLEQINQSAAQKKEQIQTNLNRLNAISQNPQLLEQQITQLNQVIETGQYQGREIDAQAIEQARTIRNQLQGWRDLTKKPQEFKKKVEEQKNKWQTELVTLQRDAENRVKGVTINQGLRVGLNSLMLAIGYSAIGWLGFKNARGIGGTKPSRSKS